MRNINREYLFIRIMTFFRYFGDCMFYGYFYLFLKSKGLLENEIGAICALTPIITLACNPFWNHLSKNANTNRNIMRIITVLEGIFIILYTGFDSVEAIAVITCLVAIVGSPFYNLHDGFTATFAETYQKNYTSIRFIGTFAYFCATLTAAIILHFMPLGYNVLLMIGGIIFISVSFWFFLIKPIDLSLTKGGEKVVRNYKQVFKNKTFWFYMLMFFLLNTIPYTADNYVSLYYTEYLEISSSSWSLIFAVTLMTEFIVLLVLSKIGDKFNNAILFLLSGTVYMLRALAFALSLPTPVLIFITLLRGLSYGCFVHANIRLLKRICGIENVTTAYFVLGIGVAVVQTISHFTFGNLISVVGYPSFFMVVASIGIIGNILHWSYLIKKKFSY